MARMLDTLNGLSARVTPTAVEPARIEPTRVEETTPPTECAPSEDSSEEPMPFIEVGPTRERIEGSPDVMAFNPRPAPFVSLAPPPAIQTAPRVVPLNAPSPLAAESSEPEDPSPSVLFRPLGERLNRGKPAFAPELIAYHEAGKPPSAPYRALLDHLLGSAHGSKAHQVLFFTSGRSEAGTTTVVLNLAITAALLGRSVLVVDANLRRPGIAGKLKLGDVPGLREVLAGHFAPEDVVRPTGLPNLKALTSGPLSGPARLTISPEKVRDLLTGCRQSYELILVDGSRWDGRTDVTAFGSGADVVYLVVSPSEVDTPAIEGLTQLIPEQGGALAGSILVGR
jgi:Mrp family chromosome partitioning ATPase